jgi:hypothetical protein
MGLGTTIKYLRRTTSGAAGSGLSTTAMYLVNKNTGAVNNWAKARYKKAVIVCVGLGLSRCVHIYKFSRSSTAFPP